MPRLENRQNRPAGEYTTSEVAAPARGQGEATKYIATLDLAPSDLADPALSIDFRVEGAIGGGAWMLLVGGTGWRGGQIGRDGQPVVPHAGWVASDNRVLTRVRVVWTQNKSASVGCSLDTERVTVSGA